MSIKISSLVWKYYPGRGTELLTALACADHAHDDGTHIFPSVAHLAEKTRQSERSVQRCLSAMRGREWLLIVRYANGGRGRATEYCINPEWIKNPENFNRIYRESLKRVTNEVISHTEPTKERVTNEVKKGVRFGSKRVTLLTPQPPIPIKEPPTTTKEFKNEIDKSSELIWSFSFKEDENFSARQLLENLALSDQQQILDEMAGLAMKNKVRQPIGLLRKLVETYKEGRFIFNAGIEYRRKTMLSTQSIHSECNRSLHSLTQTREVAEKSIADMKRIVSKKTG